MNPPNPPTAERLRFEEMPPEIVRRLKKLPKASPVLQIVAMFTHQRELPAADFNQLLLVASNPWHYTFEERQVAVWALGTASLTPEQTKEAARVLATVVEDRQVKDTERLSRFLHTAVRWSAIPALTLGSFTLIAILYSYGLQALFGGLLVAACATLFASAGLTVAFLPVAVASLTRANNTLRAMAAKVLGHLQVPQSVGALLGAVFDISPRVHRAAYEALWSVLPTLHPEHYGTLGRDVTPNLCRLLGRYELELMQEVLEALEMVGDGRAVIPVREVVSVRPDATWRATAERVLRVLEVRRDQETAPKTLLRASDSPLASPDHLLRPTQAALETAPQELLRPSGN